MNPFRTPARLVCSLATAALWLAGCDQGARPPTDPYDVGKIDLKPAPAKVSSERHKGVFAEGGALSTRAELKRLDPSPVTFGKTLSRPSLITTIALRRESLASRKISSIAKAIES